MSSLVSISTDSSKDFPDYAIDSNTASVEALGAELVFIQDSDGRYLNFYWQLAPKYGISSQKVIDHLPEDSFCPVALEAYVEKLKRIIRYGVPEQYCGLFSYQNQTFPLKLVISPILSGVNEITQVLVMGCSVVGAEPESSNSSELWELSSESYQTLLTKISRKIRRTLHLETIWQETVEGIGECLQVSRCLMLTSESPFQVKAEFCQPGIDPLLGESIQYPQERLASKFLEEYESVFWDYQDVDQPQACSMLMVPTLYQDQCNGFICIQQCDRHRHWSLGVMEFVQELAAQVGTAIAHATLYQELEEATRIAKEASQLKSEFLASTTHELRTPLNGIIGFLKLVLDDMADSEEEKQEFLEEAHQSALHLLNLINDILDLAKIESGTIDRELGAVDLAELCQAVSNFAIPQTQAKKLDFKLKLPSTLTPIAVYGNYRWLLQVMLNIVGNAIKFTPTGKITIRGEIIKQKIEWKDQTFPGKVKISVTDTGIGVSLEKQTKLFEKFVQIDGSRTKAYGGTGLGLSISQKLAEAMGGSVAFFSMGEYLGSTVTFSILLDHLPVLKTEKA
jgi:signal transduction histidine kinase